MACKSVCSRSLPHRLTVQTASVARDGYGQPIETWGADGTIRASIEQLSGTELVNAKQVNADVTHRIKTRYRADLSETNRLLFGTRAFGILNVNDVEERHREMWLLCKEIR